MFGFLFKNNPGDKHSFTTRKGKKRMATVNQVLGMPQMWSSESLAHAERMADKWQMNANPRGLSRDRELTAGQMLMEIERRQGKHSGKERGLSADRKPTRGELLLAREMMQGKHRNNPISLARTNPVRLARTNPGIRLARTNPAGKTMSARYGGKCKATGEAYEPGAEITKVDGVGWCLSKNV